MYEWAGPPVGAWATEQAAYASGGGALDKMIRMTGGMIARQAGRSMARLVDLGICTPTGFCTGLPPRSTTPGHGPRAVARPACPGRASKGGRPDANLGGLDTQYRRRERLGQYGRGRHHHCRRPPGQQLERWPRPEQCRPGQPYRLEQHHQLRTWRSRFHDVRIEEFEPRPYHAHLLSSSFTFLHSHTHTATSSLATTQTKQTR